MTKNKAQGRLKGLEPVAVIDIGSNSVRLVVYEGVVRSPTVLFNEKILCGLGKGIGKTGKLEEESVAIALRTLKRFKGLCQQASADIVYVIATAAAREAENGPAFIAEAEAILNLKIRVLTGKEEAAYSAYGIISTFYSADGVVGDLGGGSLELVNIANNSVDEGITLPLGGLRLQDMSDNNTVEARKIARKYLRKADLLKNNNGRNFYAVGGTWRNIAKLHIITKQYPLPVMHGYEVYSHELEVFLHKIAKGDLEQIKGISAISKNRRNLLSYGATVLIELIHVMEPEKIIFSGAGVREGFLYSLLSSKVQKQDPLLAACDEMATLRARSPKQAYELIDFTANGFAAFDMVERANQKRYREAACLLADIGWRIHPDFRGDQSANQIAYAPFTGISHLGRVYIALAVFFRNEGIFSENKAPDIIKLVSNSTIERARLLGGLMRVANLFSASNFGILPTLHFVKRDDKIVLQVPKRHENLIADRVLGRLQHLSKLTDQQVGFEIV